MGSVLDVLRDIMKQYNLNSHDIAHLSGISTTRINEIIIDNECTKAEETILMRLVMAIR